jgi:hypothetical protein
VLLATAGGGKGLVLLGLSPKLWGHGAKSSIPHHDPFHSTITMAACMWQILNSIAAHAEQDTESVIFEALMLLGPIFNALTFLTFPNVKT